MSGPTLGGTRLTVTGTNIGAVAGDVTVELVKTTNQVTEERTPCLVDTNGYIPGAYMWVCWCTNHRVIMQTRQSFVVHTKYH